MRIMLNGCMREMSNFKVESSNFAFLGIPSCRFDHCLLVGKMGSVPISLSVCIELRLP